MATLEIRTTGEVIQGDLVVGQITFIRPFIERELSGLWWSDDDEDFGREWATEEDVSELEDEIEDLKDDLDKEKAEVARLERVVSDLIAQPQAQAVAR